MSAKYIKKINTAEGPKQIDYNALANLPILESSDSITPATYGAVGDGETDDTDALTAIMSQNNSIIDGRNRKYKYMLITVVNAENIEIRNVIFYKGQRIDLKGCKNITFTNCRWEGINCNDEDIATCGIRLMERTDDAGNEIWCENITFNGCTFYDIWYNEKFTGSGMAHHTTGQAIVPRSAHNMFVKHCVFEQIKGNAAIHWNTYKKCGYAEITDNRFYLCGWGGICLYAYPAQYPRVVGRVCDNQFIGCGLGYIPSEYLALVGEDNAGVGCAALLGGAGPDKAPYKQHFSCENNVFEDNVESSIEGAAWNPCIGNYCIGQGALQDATNCRLMEKKYHLDYTLQVRHNPSVNFIYRNMSKQTDGTSIFEENDPIVYANNVMGNPYVDRNGFITLKGEYTQPVIFTGNTLEVTNTNTGKVYTHIMYCNFLKGARFENNHGILPYFNACTFVGDLVVDEMRSAYRCDFTKCNIITNRSRNRFPESLFTSYDPLLASLDNDQAVVEDRHITLSYYDVPETYEKPTDTVYDITSDEGYSNGYVFGGPTEHKHIDTGIKLLEGGEDWTIYLQFNGNTSTEIPNNKSGIMALFTVYDETTDSNRLLVGGQWANVYTVMKPNKSVVSLDSKTKYTMKNIKMLMRKSGNTIETWLALKDDTADSMSTHLKSTYEITTDDSLDGFAGNLYIGVQQNYNSGDMYSLFGTMNQFQVFNRAITNNEAGMLLYNKALETTSSGGNEVSTPAYNITKDSHYDKTKGYVEFDGTFGIDTGIELFANSGDFTVICKYEFANYHDIDCYNFESYPVLSAMNYTSDFKNSPGFDLVLSKQSGDYIQDEDKPYKWNVTGGFVNIRNCWKYSNSAFVDSSYFNYHSKECGIIVIRKNGVLSFYDFNMQKIHSFSGSDANTVFSGTLHIGENMVMPTVLYASWKSDNKLTGKVYDCRVYKKALSISELEASFPNIYSNEKRTKGTATCYIHNNKFDLQYLRYLFLEAKIDLGEYAAEEYADKYPKAVAIKIDGVDDVIWIPSGTDGYIKKYFYLNKSIPALSDYQIHIVNPGICPGLKAKISGFRCVLFTEETKITSSASAIDFDVLWDRTDLCVAVDASMSGYIQLLPESSTLDSPLTITSTGDGEVTATIENNTITVTGKTAGTVTLELAMPSGKSKIYDINVTEAVTA